MPSAAMTPKNKHASADWPVDTVTTTSLSGPVAPMPYKFRRKYAKFFVRTRAWDFVMYRSGSRASAWSGVSSLARQCSESGDG